jgi:holo-[acyl-carrier protein] synthase
MIIGIGIDIVEIKRIQSSLEKEAFKQLVFSKEEQRYCDNQTYPYQHYAARFAAKESFLKAIGTGLQAGHALHEIEVISDGANRPTIQLYGAFADLAAKEMWLKIHVSISHTSEMGAAQVIIEK